MFSRIRMFKVQSDCLSRVTATTTSVSPRSFPRRSILCTLCVFILSIAICTSVWKVGTSGTCHAVQRWMMMMMMITSYLLSYHVIFDVQSYHCFQIFPWIEQIFSIHESSICFPWVTNWLDARNSSMLLWHTCKIVQSNHLRQCLLTRKNLLLFYCILSVYLFFYLT